MRSLQRRMEARCYRVVRSTTREQTRRAISDELAGFSVESRALMTYLGARISRDRALRTRFEVGLQDAMGELTEALQGAEFDPAFRNSAEYAIYTGLRGTAAVLRHRQQLKAHPLQLPRLGMAASELDLLVGVVTLIADDPSQVGSKQARTTIGDEAVEAADRYVAALTKANVLGGQDAGAASDL